MVSELPRLVVAAPASGHGKTTVATGLMAALRRTGLEVSGHKVGPDYIDPGYHALATGRPGRNLDPHLVGEDLVVPLLLHGARDGRATDIAVIEGVMGLYDGHIGREGFASTAHVARLTDSPVVLVVDISHASRTIAATVLGMATFDPDVRIAGVVLNKAGSVRHSDEVRRALAPLGIPVLGVLQRDDDVTAPSRHLGLVPAAERPEAARSLDHLAGKVAASIDLEAVMRIARSAPPLRGQVWSAQEAVAGGGRGSGDDDKGRPLIAVAGGRAFTFRYAETVELLKAAGCSVAPFDPLADEALPDGTAGIYLGGGFPEVHAGDLAANEPMLRALCAATSAGVPTVAECAGLLYLCRSLDGVPMVGAIDADAAMAPRLTLAYRRSTAVADSVLAAAGAEVTGHEFHRTAVTPAAGADTEPRPTGQGSGSGSGSGSGLSASPAWTSSAGPEGFATGSVHASYLHTHWAGHPALAARFAAQVRAFAGAPQPPRRASGRRPAQLARP
ncbi:cobyrinate a,c-diamide synthase [Dietzia cinnamea]|uniref:cobyrinate a,c-diamide synthase n=1 Tax=Dietzia cinnamea TaxID=321318 RepID=UPI0021A72DDA|nr:cobyrinate a,c-diamide synthase [Dietzia cinnamea]MCT1640532.1 cobyrinate a,c-diamide synthase [Dietzia cinnamea]